MANLVIMRGLIPHFTNRKFRNGPFVLRLTDLHQSNIFVDDDSNVKCLIDLDWACSLPVETMRPPYWLTGYAADELVDENLHSFSEAHHEFMEFFEEEENLFPLRDGAASYWQTLWEIAGRPATSGISKLLIVRKNYITYLAITFSQSLRHLMMEIRISRGLYRSTELREFLILLLLSFKIGRCTRESYARLSRMVPAIMRSILASIVVFKVEFTVANYTRHL